MARVDFCYGDGRYMVFWDEVEGGTVSTMRVDGDFLKLEVRAGGPLLLKLRFESEEALHKVRAFCEINNGFVAWDSTVDGEANPND